MLLNMAMKAVSLGDQFMIDSFATSTEELGNPPHRGTVNKLRKAENRLKE